MIITEKQIVLKSFVKKLKDRETEIINYKEKDMIPLTDEESKSYERQIVCHICSFVLMKMRKMRKI